MTVSITTLAPHTDKRRFLLSLLEIIGKLLAQNHEKNNALVTLPAAATPRRCPHLPGFWSTSSCPLLTHTSEPVIIVILHYQCLADISIPQETEFIQNRTINSRYLKEDYNTIRTCLHCYPKSKPNSYLSTHQCQYMQT